MVFLDRFSSTKEEKKTYENAKLSTSNSAYRLEMATTSKRKINAHVLNNAGGPSPSQVSAFFLIPTWRTQLIDPEHISVDKPRVPEWEEPSSSKSVSKIIYPLFMESINGKLA